MATPCRITFGAAWVILRDLDSLTVAERDEVIQALDGFVAADEPTRSNLETVLAVLADEVSPDLAPLRTVDGRLGLHGLAASAYDELEGKMRALVPDLAEQLAGAADSEGERLADKAAWVAEPTLARGYGDLERAERDLARRAGLLAERARRLLAKRGSGGPSAATRAGGRGSRAGAAATAGTMLHKIEQPSNTGRSKAEIGEARKQVSRLVDAGAPVPSDLLVKGGFPAKIVKHAEAREATTRYEMFAKAATDRTVREGYEALAEQGRREARG